MALTYSPEADEQLTFPYFSLPATDGKTYESSQFQDGKPIVVMFICNHCPYVQAIEHRLIELTHRFKEQVHFIGICSNDPDDYPEDSFDGLKKRAEELKYPFIYLHDEDQTVAKNFKAVCTPDLYLFSEDYSLVYRGRLDDSWKDADKVSSQDLAEAIEATLKNENISFDSQIPSMGCSIKWKS